MNIPKLDIEIIQNKNSTNMKIKKYMNSSDFGYMNGGTYIWLSKTGNIFKHDYSYDMVPLMFDYIPVKALESKYSYGWQREIKWYRVKKI